VRLGASRDKKYCNRNIIISYSGNLEISYSKLCYNNTLQKKGGYDEPEGDYYIEAKGVKKT
jgi:hypothetical protein